MKFGNTSTTGKTAGNVEESDFGIDQSNMGMLFDRLVSYQDPIPSVVREITSNALDAVDEARTYRDKSAKELIEGGWVDFIAEEDRFEYASQMSELFADWEEEDVKVELLPPTDCGGSHSEFIVTDKGVGLSEDRIENIYSKFFSSTKRGTDGQIGGFGLGAKSPLGYGDEMFTLETVYNGRKQTWMIRKGEKRPVKSKMMDQPTNEENGTRVRVPIIDGSDMEKFKTAAVEQLSYMDGIRFVNIPIDPAYIIKGKNFVYRQKKSDGSSPFNRIHLCLGKVHYPLNLDSFTDREIKRMGFESDLSNTPPIGLHFEMKEVSQNQEEGKVTLMQTRENVQYNPCTREAIIQKMKEVRKEVQRIYDKQNRHEVDTMAEYYQYIARRNKGEIVVDIDENVRLQHVTDFIDTSVEFKSYKDLPKLPAVGSFFYGWEPYRKIYGGESFSEEERYIPSVESIMRNKLEGEDEVYLMDRNGRMSSKVNKFLSWQYKKKSVSRYAIHEAYVVKPKKGGVSLGDRQRMFGFSLGNRSASPEEKELIDKFIEERDKFIEQTFPKYADIEPTEEYDEWVKAQKAKDRSSKRDGRVDNDEYFPIKHIERERGDFKWSMSYMRESEAANYNGLTIYGHSADEEKLFTVANILYKDPSFRTKYKDVLLKKRASILKIAKGNASKFKYNPHAMHVDKFITSRHNVLKRHVTAYYMRKNVSQAAQVLSSDLIEEVMPRVHKASKFVSSYINQYWDKNRDISGLDEELLSYFISQERVRRANLESYKIHKRRLSKKGISEDELPPPPSDKPVLDQAAMERAKILEDTMEAWPLLKALDLNTATKEDVLSYIELRGKKLNPNLVAKLVNRK